MANNRLFYGVTAIGIAPEGSTTAISIHGAQSAGITTRFNIEQIYELGKVASYFNYENIPDIEVTIEKVLDGHPLVYHSATQGAATGTLPGRSARRCNFTFLSVNDTAISTAAGTNQASCFCSGMYISSVSYTFPVEGNATESTTLVGNNKSWVTSFTQAKIASDDAPEATLDIVQRREHFIVGVADGATSTIPLEVQGTVGVTRGPISVGKIPFVAGSGTPSHLQSVKVTANLNRESLYELGRKPAYFRYVPFPVEIQTEIEVLCIDGDHITALEDNAQNTFDQTIEIYTVEGTKIFLGDYNRLTNVTYGGANAGQGTSNATITYSYSNYDSRMTVVHPNDPTVALRA